jgi:hypothetical protein
MAMNLKAVTACMGYEQIATLSSAASLTVPTRDKQGNLKQPTFALIVAETQGVRWRDDGTAPTASVGMPLAVGVPLQYDGDLKGIRFIEQAASAKINISYYY